MHIYSYCDYEENHAGARYFGTINDAHAEAKKLEPVWRCNVRICLLDIPADKAGLLELLNCGGPHRRSLEHGAEIKALRTWTLTARGGLKELTPSA